MLIILCECVSVRVCVCVEQRGVFMHVQQSVSCFGCLVCFSKLKRNLVFNGNCSNGKGKRLEFMYFHVPNL